MTLRQFFCGLATLAFSTLVLATPNYADKFQVSDGLVNSKNPWVQLVLPKLIYATSVTPALQDLALYNTKNQPVPFQLQAPSIAVSAATKINAQPVSAAIKKRLNLRPQVASALFDLSSFRKNTPLDMHFQWQATDATQLAQVTVFVSKDKKHWRIQSRLTAGYLHLIDVARSLGTVHLDTQYDRYVVVKWPFAVGQLELSSATLRSVQVSGVDFNLGTPVNRHWKNSKTLCFDFGYTPSLFIRQFYLKGLPDHWQGEAKVFARNNSTQPWEAITKTHLFRLRWQQMWVTKQTVVLNTPLLRAERFWKFEFSQPITKAIRLRATFLPHRLLFQAHPLEHYALYFGQYGAKKSESMSAHEFDGKILQRGFLIKPQPVMGPVALFSPAVRTRVRVAALLIVLLLLVGVFGLLFQLRRREADERTAD